MNFNSRESYLQARAEWRANYATLSAEIREARMNLVTASREHSKDQKKIGDLWSAISARKALIAKANEALSARQAMKEEAARQWEEKHVAVM